MNKEIIEKAKETFGKLVEDQLGRVEKMRMGAEWLDFATIKPIIIGVCWGDGIGEEISKVSEQILREILEEDVKAGKVEFRTISGLTIDNRVKHNKAIPDDVLAELKACHVILKGPTTTPQAGDPWPNIESANVAMRRELDLFANVRPVKIPRDKIDWIFFRENTEGAYVLGSKGLDVGPDISFDFTVATQEGCERIIRMAFEYAKKNNIKRVTAVTKSNVVKTTDGRFSRTAKNIAEEYKVLGIVQDEWYIDIMTAKLLDPERRSEFRVMVLPNLYGDIITDEAAQLQGGVGTAGSANIGKRWAMFEAIHGSAPRMVKEGRAKYADPCSMIRACAMLLRHIGYAVQGERLEQALDICGGFEKKYTITGRDTGVTGKVFGDYVLSWVNNPKLAETYKGFTGTV